MTTRVVHCQVSNFDIYCGRPSIWGNEYSHKPNTTAKYKVKTREEAIASHRRDVLANKEFMKKIRKELKGKRLGCWCSPLPCHCDIYVELCEMPEEEFNKLIDKEC